MTNKEKLQERKNNNMFYSVIPSYDFGKVPEGRFGIKILTKREAVSVDKCKDLIAKLEDKFGGKITRIEVDMSRWDYSAIAPEDIPYLESGDMSVPRQGVAKKATYNPSKNCLRIWEDGMPIYENDNGRICRDADALADCLM